MISLQSIGAVIVVSLASITATAPAAAQRSDDERARIHFEAGRSYFNEGDYERALSEWQRSYELSDRHELLLNIATSLERLARWGDAADALERYLGAVQEVPDREVLERRIQNLRQRAAERREVEPAPEEPTGPVDAGTPPPVTEPTPSPPPVTADTTGGAGLPMPSLVSYIAAGVGLVTFAIFGSLALSEEGDVADGCGTTRTCGDDDLDPIDTKALIADIGLGVAVVGAAVGTVLWLTADGGGDREASAALMPWVAPASVGAAAHVSF